MKNIKQISNWGIYNRKKTRVIIALLQIGLILLGMFYASILQENGINVSKYFLFGSVGMFVFSVFFYPFISLRKRKLLKLFKYSYRKQKFYDFIIAINIFLFIVFAFYRA